MQINICFSYLSLIHAFPISQPLEFPKKSAPVPSNATTDPAKRRPASCSAAGDWQRKPRAAAGEEYKESCVL